MKSMLVAACFIFGGVRAQSFDDLTKLTAYKSSSATWKSGGDVRADLSAPNRLVLTTGEGVLANILSNDKHGQDLYTLAEHGDADISLDYMLAKGANSGIYLQGRYEVQLNDSWGVINPASHDNGGIYERWDESRPVAAKGFEGHAPRQNATRAPGTWQHLEISFQAPRFSNAGQKTENARILRLALNGVVIHENVELSGPTRGSMGDETARGPIRLQGDHGAVAFRNFRIVNFSEERPVLKNIHYTVYNGLFEKEPDYSKVRSLSSGDQSQLSVNIKNLPDTFLIRYTGTLEIKKAGEYVFYFSSVAGKGRLRINGKELGALSDDQEKITAVLPAGDLPLEILFTKVQNWGRPVIIIRLSGPGFREFVLSDANEVSTEISDPILVNASSNTLLRSFMDIPGKRIVHAVSVGSPGGVHYTYDMDRGAIVQVWRGGFLDATPMWHERGDGSSRPTGAVQLLGDPVVCVDRLSSISEVWKKDTSGTGFKTKGYSLDAVDRPVFKYMINAAQVSDSIGVLSDNTGLQRTIGIRGGITGMYSRIAAGAVIEELSTGFYLVDKSYYIRIDDPGGAAPVVRTSAGQKELIVPVSSKLVYSILF